MIEQLNLSVRLVALGAALLLLAILLAGRVRPRLKVVLAGLLVGSSAYLLNSSALIVSGSWWEPWFDLLSLLTAFWVWLFARRLFENEPPLWAMWCYIAIYVACWFLSNFVPATGLFGFYVIHIASLALIVDLVRIAFAERADDLIEKRRVIRIWLPLLVAAQAGSILAYELVIGSGVLSPAVQLTNASLILALTVFAGLALLNTDPELLLETGGRGAPKRSAAPDLSPSEKVLADRLEAAMTAGFYRTPGLSIAVLADRVETPEHRLRALINRRLGYRNFSDFLNSHRIAEAKRILADAEHVDLPVLTIAMDLGYNSLPTFNRAFRVQTGTTPTEFRRDAIGQN